MAFEQGANRKVSRIAAHPASYYSHAMIPSTAPLPVVFRGRRWFAGFLIAMAFALMLLAIGTLFLDQPWFAFIVMGSPALLSTAYCLSDAYGEFSARIQLRNDGFSMRMPGYYGWLAKWPRQEMEAHWSDITHIDSHVVHGHMLLFPFDYVVHKIATRNSTILLVEALPGPFRNARGITFGLPVREIMAFVKARAESAKCAPDFA
jgi:hypothetical protein